MTVRALKTAQEDQTNPSKLCTRGLEKFVNVRESQHIRENQITVIRSVLEAQQKHRMMRIQDDIGIRIAATAASKWAAARAIETARKDAIAAHESLDGEDLTIVDETTHQPPGVKDADDLSQSSQHIQQKVVRNQTTAMSA